MRCSLMFLRHSSAACGSRSLATMANITQRAFAKGTECPPLESDTLRLYSMRFCPYAQRTRLVLDHKNIEYETVNVNLKHKPDWFFEKNPLGLVPILEKNDTIIYESTVCDDYVDEVYPQTSLMPTDPYEKARLKILMEIFGKTITTFYKFRSANEDKQKLLEEIFKQLSRFEESLTDKFFGGKDPCMVDFHIWPWFERMPVMKELSGADMLPPGKFPKLTQWTKNMLEVPAVKKTYLEPRFHREFFIGLMTGIPNYDIGLESAKM